MPPLETMGRTRDAVLWPFKEPDTFGEPRVEKAVPIRVRFERGLHEGMDKDGHPITLACELVVDREIQVDSLMFLDKLEHYASGKELFLVKSYDEVPDIKGRNVRRTIGLMRFTSDPVPVA